MTASKINVATAAGCVGVTSNVATGTGLPLGIPDLGNSSVTFAVTKPAGCGSVADVNLTFNVAHTVGADLTFELTDPAATTVMLLVNNPAGPWADSNNGFPGITLDDEAANLIPDCFTSPNGTGCSAGDMLTGSYRPHNALSGFDTHAGNGTWTLKISDKLGSNTGTINSASIFITWAP